MFPPAQPTLAIAIDEERLVMARVAGSRSAPRLIGFFAQELASKLETEFLKDE